MSDYKIGEPVKQVPHRFVSDGKYAELISRILKLGPEEWLPVTFKSKVPATSMIATFRKKGLFGSQQFEVKQRSKVVYLRAIRPKGKL